MRYFYYPILFIVFAFSSCVKENPVPAYIHIPAFNLTTSIGQGSSSQRISDVWVYVNGQINGVFPLPATLPIVETGSEIELALFPGIRNNGTRSNPIIYPMYSRFSTKRTLKSGQIDTIRPSITYSSDVQFKLVEDFENQHVFRANRDNNPNLNITAVSGFEGRCGQIVLTNANPLMEKASTTKVKLPDNAANIYIELNYKTDSPLSVGVVGTDVLDPIGLTTYKITLFPNREWNKTYLNVTNEVKELRRTDFQVVFRSLKPDSLSQATIQIDNVKLIQR